MVTFRTMSAKCAAALLIALMLTLSTGAAPAAAAGPVVEPGDVLIGTIDCDVPGQSVSDSFNNFGALSTSARIGDDPGDAAGATADAIRYSDGFYWSIVNCETIELGIGWQTGTLVEIHPLDSNSAIGSLGPSSGIVVQTAELSAAGYNDYGSDDQIRVLAGVAPVSIWTHGWEGDDTLMVDPTHSGYVYFDGAGGNDTAIGSGGANWFLGRGGNDTLVGLGGPDKLEGGDDNDNISGGAGEDEIDGGPGVDDLRGGGGGDTIEGGDGNDTIDGQGGPDWIDGGPGNDTIDGRGAADTLLGGDGADVMNGQNGGDDFFGLAGNDTMSGQTGPDTFVGDSGDDDMFGGDGADTFFGGSGFDKCSGNTGPDQAEAATCEQTPGVETLF